MTKMKFTLIFLSVALGTVGQACDLCSVYMARDARQGAEAVSHVGLYEQFTSFGTLNRDGKKISNDLGQKLQSSISQFFYSYEFASGWGAQITLPIISRSYSRAGESGLEKGSLNGLGDTAALARYSILDLDRDGFSLSLKAVGGLKLPTGNAERISEELSENEEQEESGIHGHDLALGTGSYDFVTGLSADIVSGRFVLPLSVQYTLRTQGRFGYRFGDDLQWRFDPGYYLLLEHEATLSMSLALSGEIKGADSLEGVHSNDTAMNSVFTGLQLSGTGGERLSWLLAYEVPASLSSNGLQVVPDSRVRASLTWNF